MTATRQQIFRAEIARIEADPDHRDLVAIFAAAMGDGEPPDGAVDRRLADTDRRSAAGRCARWSER